MWNALSDCRSRPNDDSVEVMYETVAKTVIVSAAMTMIAKTRLWPDSHAPRAAIPRSLRNLIFCTLPRAKSASYPKYCSKTNKVDATFGGVAAPEFL
jgi:hypothetical protein